MEAHWLFDLPYERIDAIIHPQSIIHSMVQYVDGSILAQMSVPDMSLPFSMLSVFRALDLKLCRQTSTASGSKL
jgi:1-deoxy-D-xylulose-5-phosphate reductoisomerase